MNIYKTKANHCKCCLTKNDLILITNEKQKIITSLLNLPFKNPPNDYRICINCNSSLACFDKFRKNSIAAHTILEKCKLKNTFLSSVTDESVNSAFDTILNWMNDVTVIMKYLSDVKMEENENFETESVHEEYEGVEVLHEEEMFVGHVDAGIKKENEVKSEPEIEFVNEAQSTENDSDYVPEIEEEENEEKPLKRKKEIDYEKYKKYTCDCCEKKFASRLELTYHLNVHAGVNPYECGIDNCTKSYPHPRTLKVHQREVHYILNGKRLDPPPEKEQDPEFDEKLDELRDENFVIESFYVESRKGNKRPYQCRICSRFYNKTEFGYHRNKHLGLKPFACEKCDRSFTTPFDLQKHNRQIHQKNKCSDGDSDASDSENDEKTSIYHDISMQSTEDDTNNYRALEQYFVPDLRGCRRAYQCPECQKLYSRGELKYHLNTHKNVKPYVCAIENCEKTFASPRDMRVHALKFHKIKVKPVKDYSMKETRVAREKIEKLDVVEYKKIDVICTVCGKSVRKKHFREHFQTHVKPDLSCPYQGCSENFKNKMKLTSHIQAKHDPDYLPATVTTCMCEHCGKRLTKAQLKYHMNLHLGKIFHFSLIFLYKI